MHAHQDTPSRTPKWITKQVVGTSIAAIAAAVMSTYKPLEIQGTSTNFVIGKASYSIDLGSRLLRGTVVVSKDQDSTEARISKNR
jgi:hypothetical protein